jgi:hypothetical protein
MANLELFMDMTNALNIKHFTTYGFKDQNDFTQYMTSLHLPSEIADKLQYGNIPGSDSPGDYHDFGIDFVPMVWTKNTASVPTSNIVPSAIYYDNSTAMYMQYKNNAWVQADQGKVDQALNDKAYIDMPNLNYYTFLNPRSIFWGVRLTFDL